MYKFLSPVLLPVLLIGLVACGTQGDGQIDPDRPERNCTDGTDNDEDGLVDCEDSDCADACGGGEGTAEVCDNGTDDDLDGDTDCDDSDCSESCEETCDNGVDDDADGLVDCDDEECADFGSCWWPETIAHDGQFAFAGRSFDCFGTQRPDDCMDTYTTTLSEVSEGACPDCDRTFTGTFDWASTSCNAEYGDGAPPSSGRFGFVFANQNKWVLFAESGGVWTEAAVLDRSGAGFQLKRTDPVNVDTGVCGEKYVGDLTTTLTFTE